MPTDLAIKKKGIHIASKCLCCYSNLSNEFNNYLFISSDTTKEVWALFSTMMNVDENFLTINHLLSVWCYRSKGNCLQSWLLRVLPLCIFWNIRGARNSAKFDSRDMKQSDMIASTRDQIR